MTMLTAPMHAPPSFWSVAAEEELKNLGTSPQGLSSPEAQLRLSRYGPNTLKARGRTGTLTLLLAQFKSPLVVLLLLCAGLSWGLGDASDAIVIFVIVLVSAFLGFWQERGATNAVQKLLSMVKINADVLRDGAPRQVPVEQIVPGDIVLLSAGDAVPGDCLILESNDLFVDEAALTGETFPVEKSAATLASDTPLARRTNALWMGTHVVSGSAKAVVVSAGRATEFGKISDQLRLRPAETEFAHGVRRFGYFLMEITLVLVILIFGVNVYYGRPPLDSVLFSLALAVGLTPQLLPAIISVNLAQGARRMAEAKVIVKRLDSIENLGSMDVLCSDKTGTLTEGFVHLQAALDSDGNPSDKVLLYAYLNSSYETGFTNPIDQAIRDSRKFDLSRFQKLDEVPYDFARKRLSILVFDGEKRLMVTKGALSHVLDVCTTIETPAGTQEPIQGARDRIGHEFEKFCSQGLRVLGVAYRDLGTQAAMSQADEASMVFLGFLVFLDPPKPGVADTVNRLKATGVSLKIITGDSALTARHLSEVMGLPHQRVMDGVELRRTSDEALLRRVEEIDVFAEVEPNEKQRIIVALRKAGHVVGYMGDGINDASALHAADVGLSVDSAADVAKEAADIVLLEKDLEVLVTGVREGRVTFANTLKYVFMATSANFGNMFSMAGASLFLPFLPLLPKQILLMNVMTDLPEMTIASDSVDDEMVQKPRRWDVAFIRKFMLAFGILSSVFDYCTFGALLFLLGGTQAQFRTGWFVESVISAAAVVLVIRTRKPFYRSKPGSWLMIATLAVVLLTLVLPLTPLAAVFGFQPLTARFLLVVGLIVLLYIAAAEVVKRRFYSRVEG